MQLDDDAVLTYGMIKKILVKDKAPLTKRVDLLQTGQEEVRAELAEVRTEMGDFTRVARRLEVGSDRNYRMLVDLDTNRETDKNNIVRTLTDQMERIMLRGNKAPVDDVGEKPKAGTLTSAAANVGKKPKESFDAFLILYIGYDMHETSILCLKLV